MSEDAVMDFALFRGTVFFSEEESLRFRIGRGDTPLEEKPFEATKEMSESFGFKVVIFPGVFIA